ncbi:MAG TPA: amidohydrolase family protein [Firmicutes bacterium]|nr:amidohydrolase family protein [Bacillota bacterium]
MPLGKLLFKGTLIIDGCSPEPYSGDVLVEGDRIAAVGRVLQTGPDVQEVDSSGYTILPGLIDCHVHLCLDGGTDPLATVAREAAEVTLARAATNAFRQLIAGVTTVRDCGGRAHLDLLLRDCIDQGICVGPRVLASGLCLTTTGGHAHAIGREADDARELAKGARLELKAGADQLKVMATGGVITRGTDPRRPQYSAEELGAVVAQATQAGKKVVAHAQAVEGIRACAQAGVASVEHGVFLDEDTARLLKNQGVWLVPTLTPSFTLLDLFRSDGVPGWTVDRARELRLKHWAGAALAIREGVKVAAGTDAGVTLTPHGMVATEVRLLHERGLGRYEAILAATRWAAELLGLDDEVGTLESDKAADLILVRGNPLHDLHVLQRPVLVMKAGIVYRNELGAGPPAWPCGFGGQGGASHVGRDCC